MMLCKDTHDSVEGRHKTVQKGIDLVAKLRCCTEQNDLQKGSQLHANILKQDLLKRNVFVGNTLVSMYAKCGALAKARQVFEELLVQTVVSWTALIAGFAHNGHGMEALECFDMMKCRGLVPDAQTFSCVLKACGSIGAADKGDEIHTEIVEKGLLKENRLLANASVAMFAKCGLFEKAQKVLDKVPSRNVISWNAIISGYAQRGQCEEALNCLEQMQRDGLSPNAVTFACMLNACGGILAVEKGREIHLELLRLGLLGRSVLESALVDMYAKCGALVTAQQVFDSLPLHNVVTWTALISGYAEAGNRQEIFDSFSKMIAESVEPNQVTFFIVLNACSHLGLVDEGETYFDVMSKSYGIVPTCQHLICMVGLFGCSGQLDKALELVMEKPCHEFFPVWSVLLAACERMGNAKLAQEAFDHAIRLNGKATVPYVCMSNIYASGTKEDADSMEVRSKKMLESG